MRSLHGKGKYQITDNTNMRIKSGNSYRKNEEVFRWKAQIDTWKYNHALILNYFDSHKGLRQSEENKCIWTYNKDGLYFFLSSGNLFIFLIRVSLFIPIFILSEVFSYIFTSLRLSLINKKSQISLVKLLKCNVIFNLHAELKSVSMILWWKFWFSD